MRIAAFHKEANCRSDIDGSRAIAVLLVVACHAFPAFFRHGYIGVGVFFVMSGYLITGIPLRGQAAGIGYLQAFYGRRVGRIFPALVVVSLTTAVTSYVVLFPAEFKSFTRYVAASAAFVSNVVSWLSEKTRALLWDVTLDRDATQVALESFDFRGCFTRELAGSAASPERLHAPD